jgi:type I restriction enzyme S subunit
MGGEWREVKLGEVVSLNPDTIGGDWPHPYIKYIDISSVGEGLIVEPPQILRLDEAPSRAKRLVQEGDTVLSTVRPARRSMFFVKQSEPEWVVSTGFAVLRPRKRNIEPRYLYACVYDRAFTEFLVRREKGAAYPAVLPEDIADAVIKLPPLPEQRAIAHILGTLDDKIELNRRMSETLEEMARVLFKAWFVDFEPVRAKMEGRWRRGESLPGFPAHLYDLFPDRLVQSELGEIPEGWEVGTLGDLSQKPQYGYTASAKEEPVGPKFLRITDINKLPWIDWTTVPYCEIEPEDFEQYRLHLGDVLIARMADPGHGVVVEEQVEAVFASYLIRFRLKDQAYIRYIQYWLRSDGYWQLVTSRHAGTTRASLNAQVLSSFQLIIPPKPIASAFSEIVNALRNKVVAAVNESRTLAGLRDALLPKLIRGEIRVKDAESFLNERGL